MPQSLQIEEFRKKTSNKLLVKLLEAYLETVNLPEERQVSRLVQQMKTELQERRYADPHA